MSWLALSTRDRDWFAPGGLDQSPADAQAIVALGRETLMARGSLVFETRLPAAASPVPLVILDRSGSGGFYLSLSSIPGGGLNLVIRHQGCVLAHTLNHSDAGRTDVLRVIYAWDAPRRRARLVLERPDSDRVIVVPIDAPRPMRVQDLRALMCQGKDRYLAAELMYMALSAGIEPIGPMPTMAPQTPLLTPDGYKPISALRRGDLVLTRDGRTVPVLHRLVRTVPALGAFRPVRLRAPYFGLLQDITVGSSQKIMLDGSDVEYLFGREEVLIPAGHLTGTHAARTLRTRPLATYMQVLLPSHEAPVAAGCAVESLFIGRLRRNRDLLALSLLADTDRNALPEHAQSLCPVLPAFDALFLAERRVA